MPKKFIHETLGWIAIECEKEKYYMIDKGGTGKFSGTITKLENGIIKQYLIDKELIENSQDWVEIIEKDWIDACVADICAYQRGRPGDEPDYVTMRKIIEQHLPKEKKFTKEYVESKYEHSVDSSVVIGFLKANNLLSYDE